MIEPLKREHVEHHHTPIGDDGDKYNVEAGGEIGEESWKLSTFKWFNLFNIFNNYLFCLIENWQ